MKTTLSFQLRKPGHYIVYKYDAYSFCLHKTFLVHGQMVVVNTDIYLNCTNYKEQWFNLKF